MTPHFTLEELTGSNTGMRYKVSNNPDERQQVALLLLCEKVLEPIRTHFAKPVIVLSAFRSPDLNKLVGGAPTSQHLYGEAADITIHGVANADLFRYIQKDIPFDQLIGERLVEKDGARGWIHVSYSRLRLRYDVLSSPASGKYVKGLVFA